MLRSRFVGFLMLALGPAAYAENSAPAQDIQPTSINSERLDQLEKDVSDLKNGLNEVRTFIDAVTYNTSNSLMAIPAIAAFWAAITSIQQLQRQARRFRQEQEHNKQLHEREIALERRLASNDEWTRGVMEIFTKGEEAAQRRASQLHDH